jgi:SNF family Na+-dependent transporter
MKETKKLLMTIYVAGIVLALAIVCLYETNVLEAGLLATDKQSEFLLTFLMELMTLGCAFLALRLFKFEKIHQELTTGKAVALRKWGVLRLQILLVPLWADTLLYYIYMNPTFGYLGIILALCLPFVYPSMNRCEAETEE